MDCRLARRQRRARWLRRGREGCAVGLLASLALSLTLHSRVWVTASEGEKRSGREEERREGERASDGDGRSQDGGEGASSRSFVRVAQIDTHAASGLATFSDGEGEAYIAIANYYAASELFLFQPAIGPPRRVQTFPSNQAHDWEAIRMPDGSTQLLLAETGEQRSFVYQLNDSTASQQLWPRVPLISCEDASDAKPNCGAWRTAGECERNAGFMLAKCRASCERCRERGPLVAVQQLPVDAASASRHFRVGERLFLGISERLRVSFYEWQPSAEGRWVLFGSIPVAGVCELSHARLSADLHVLALARWHSGQSFVSHSLIYHFYPQAKQPFSLIQELPSSGAHDVEFFFGPRSSSQALWLLVANARDDSSQRVYSHLYSQTPKGFELKQQVHTTGAHDWDVMQVNEQLLIAVANQGEGVSCSANGTVGVFIFQSDELVELEHIRTGCTVFARFFYSDERVYLAVAVERVGDDATNQSSYDTQSLIFLWD